MVKLANCASIKLFIGSNLYKTYDTVGFVPGGNIFETSIATQKEKQSSHFSSLCPTLFLSAGHTSIIKLMLEMAASSGANCVIVNYKDKNGEAPIHVATRCGSTKILKLLISHRANLSLIDGHGRTCLHLAAQSGHGSSLALALDSGAGKYLKVLSDDGFTALYLAVCTNRADCMRILLKAKV